MYHPFFGLRGITTVVLAFSASSSDWPLEGETSSRKDYSILQGENGKMVMKMFIGKRSSSGYT
jgi:hypothetical protein